MTKSKNFWAALALVSLGVMAYSGWSVYNRISQHFSGDTIEVRPVPMPPPSVEDKAALAGEDPEQKAAKEAEEDRKEEAAAGRTAAASKAREAVAKTEAHKAEAGKQKAVRTPFEYKDAAARSVKIAGTFTSWKEKPMKKSGGVWKTEVYILPGTYPFHFVVDGKSKPAPDLPRTPGGESLVKVE